MIKAQMLLNQASQQAAAGEVNEAMQHRSKRRRSREEHAVGGTNEEDDRSVSRRHLYHKNDPNKHQQRGDQGRHSVRCCEIHAFSIVVFVIQCDPSARVL